MVRLVRIRCNSCWMYKRDTGCDKTFSHLYQCVSVYWIILGWAYIYLHTLYLQLSGVLCWWVVMLTMIIIIIQNGARQKSQFFLQYLLHLLWPWPWPSSVPNKPTSKQNGPLENHDLEHQCNWWLSGFCRLAAAWKKKDPDQVGVVKVDLVLVFGAEKGENVLMELSLRPLFLGRHALT